MDDGAHRVARIPRSVEETRGAELPAEGLHPAQRLVAAELKVHAVDRAQHGRHEVLVRGMGAHHDAAQARELLERAHDVIRFQLRQVDHGRRADLGQPRQQLAVQPGSERRIHALARADAHAGQLTGRVALLQALDRDGYRQSRPLREQPIVAPFLQLLVGHDAVHERLVAVGVMDQRAADAVAVHLRQELRAVAERREAHLGVADGDVGVEDRRTVGVLHVRRPP